MSTKALTTDAAIECADKLADSIPHDCSDVRFKMQAAPIIQEHFERMLHTRLETAENDLAQIKTVKTYVQQQATTADVNSHEWQPDQARGITDINAAYRAGMWYAYRDVLNRLP